MYLSGPNSSIIPVMNKLFTLGLFCICVWAALADESPGEEGAAEVIPWVRLPLVCQNAIKSLGLDLELFRIEAKQEYGMQVYEIRLAREGAAMKVELTSTGRFLEVEEVIPVERLPPAVHAMMHQSSDDKTEVRATAVVLYAYKIEFEDGRPPQLVDASGKAPRFERD